MPTHDGVIDHSLRAIQCPSCLQMVSPAAGDACPMCCEDLSVLLALCSVIGRLSSSQLAVADTSDSVDTRGITIAIESSAK